MREMMLCAAVSELWQGSQGKLCRDCHQAGTTGCQHQLHIIACQEAETRLGHTAECKCQMLSKVLLPHCRVWMPDAVMDVMCRIRSAHTHQTTP